MFDTEKWLGRRVFDNWDLTNAVLNFSIKTTAVIILMLLPGWFFILTTGWPSQQQPRSNECPVIYESDSGNVLAQKIEACKQYYKKQY